MGCTARVLVVDDDEAIRDLLSYLLAEEGFEVTVAVHGAEALRQVEQSPPHVILLDMRMPVMDGWQFASAYRQRAGPHAPIICMTAAHDVAQRAAQIGAQGVLAKPFDIDTLLTMLADYVP